MGKSKATVRKQSSSEKLGLPISKKKVKRLNAKAAQPIITTHNLNDDNIYNILNVEKTARNKQKQNEQTGSKPTKPPPLIVTDKNCKIDNILSENGINDFNFKFMSIGTKVFVENDNDFDKISAHLKANNIDHFTYASKDTKVCKVVLSGLPELPIETVKADLASLNIQPELIIQMTTRIRNPHRALYLLHLNGNEIKFQDLQKVRAICHTIVRWSLFKPKFKGPTQCRNCTMYGHGTRNCNRKPTCTLCASNEHNQSDCPLSKLPKDSPPVYKCSYCISNKLQPTNHRANDPNCPARNAYVNARKSVASKQVNKNADKAKTTNWNSTQMIPAQMIPAPIPPPLQRSFKDVVASNMNNQQDTVNNSTNDELFTTTELFKIFASAIEQIRSCKTKLDQIQVITNLLSYVV